MVQKILNNPKKLFRNSPNLLIGRQANMIATKREFNALTEHHVEAYEKDQLIY